MRMSSVSSLALNIVAFSGTATAYFIPDFFQTFDVLKVPQKRCANPCGYYGQLCCASGESCYTDTNGQAQCGAGSVGSGNGGQQQGGQNGQWQYFTTTYVMTDLKTITTTFSSWVPAQTPAPTGIQCAFSQGEAPCGSVCCHAGQFCQTLGSCMEVPGGSSQYYSNIYTITQVVTNTAAPGIRPTTQTILTLTATGSPTATGTYQMPVGTGGAVLTGGSQSSGGLSGGAIAGIVIGVIAGIIILLLICACFCFKGLLDGLLAIFGLGPRRKRRTEETTYIEERRSRHSGAAAAATAAGGAGFARRWFGQRPAKTEVIEEKKQTGTLTRMLGVAGVLGGLAVALGLKRRHDRKEEDDRSSTGYGSSAYYYSDYTSVSSPSSVTRTRSRSRSRSRYSRR